MKKFYIKNTWFDLYDSKSNEERIVFESDDEDEVMKKAKSIALSQASIDSTSTYYFCDRDKKTTTDIRNFEL